MISAPRAKWTENMRAALERHVGPLEQVKSNPGKSKMEDMIKKEPSLSHMSVQQVTNFFLNLKQKNKKQKNST